MRVQETVLPSGHVHARALGQVVLDFIGPRDQSVASCSRTDAVPSDQGDPGVVTPGDRRDRQVYPGPHPLPRVKLLVQIPCNISPDRSWGLLSRRRLGNAHAGPMFHAAPPPGRNEMVMSQLLDPRELHHPPYGFHHQSRPQHHRPIVRSTGPRYPDT